MKLFLFLNLIFTFSVFANTYSQSTISIEMENSSVKSILNRIEERSTYRFFYNEELSDINRLISIDQQNKEIGEILYSLLKGTDLEYTFLNNNMIVIAPKREEIIHNNNQALVEIRGTVTDHTGITLPGVNVTIKGTTRGTVTDVNGHYQLQADQGAILVFSFTGMLPVEVLVQNQTVINVTLFMDIATLEEIVVVGYGSVRRGDLTGSVASVSAENLAGRPVASVGAQLQGRAAGVQIISSGEPGQDVTIRVRGTGTINNNNPLIVIDGVPVQSGLDHLNPNDVESIQILKDASATAIYGSRGANGVVIVTTKRGDANTPRLDFNAYNGIQEASNRVQVLDAADFALLHNEMMDNAGRPRNPGFADPEQLASGTDWIDIMFRPALIQNYSLSYSGGNDRNTYYISGMYLDQQGIINSTGFNRFTMKFNSDTRVFDNVRFGNQITMSSDRRSSGNYSVRNILMALPTMPVYNEDGSYAGPKERPEWEGDIINPLGLSEMIENTTSGYNLLGNLFGEIDIVENLVFRTSFGLKAAYWYNRNWTPKYNWSPTPQESSFLSQAANRDITWNWDNHLTFNHTFNDVHRMTLLLGTSAQENRFEYMSGSIQEFASNNTQQLTNGTAMPQISGNASEWALLSYMGRANYAYDNKYLVTATLRRDGSSRFGAGNKWGWFPSASVAWRVSKESFMEQASRVDDLKIRAGYGITGNQEIGNYAFASNLMTIVYNFGDNTVPAVVPRVMPNPIVQWEAQKQTNIGMDLLMFNQRLEVVLDAYIKNTEKMLVPMSVPVSTGYSDIFVPSINAGEIQNRGVEMTVASRNMIGDFKWNTDLNISFNRNKVISINDTIPMSYGSVGFNHQIARIAPGMPVGVFYGFVTDGIFQTQEEVDNHAAQMMGNDPYNRTSPGDIRFRDLNSDGIIDDNDRAYLGSPNPDYIFAVNNHFEYSGFDLNILLQGVYGNKLFNANRIWNEGMAVAVNQSKETLNRWNGPGTSTYIPRAVFNDPNNNARVSDRWLEDGSFVRIKELALGYTLPERVASNIRMQRARIYVMATNLLTFTPYTGFDPEVPVSGIDNSIYPMTRTFTVGVNVNL